jgi:putative redox protein
MSQPTPRLTLDLTWLGDLRFSGTAGGPAIVLDSAGVAGPSPVQNLALSLAGCMAMDVAHILAKGRARVDALTVRLVAERAPEEPRRIVAAEARFSVTADVSPDKVERAIALSREKYCSVWHSMRQDIRFTTSFELTRPSTA